MTTYKIAALSWNWTEPVVRWKSAKNDLKLFSDVLNPKGKDNVHFKLKGMENGGEGEI